MKSSRVVHRLTTLVVVLGVLAGLAVPAAGASARPVGAAAAPGAPLPTHPADDHMGSTIRQHEPATGPQASSRVLSPQASTSGSQPLGNDVSSYQGDVSWGSVAASGAAFTYVKATEGTDYQNLYYGSQYNGSANAGLIRGAYHFALPDQSSGQAQATFFVQHGGGWTADGRTLPPMLDIEYNPYGAVCYGLSAAQMSAWVSDFSTTVHALTSRFPMIYTTRGWWDQCTGTNSSFGTSNPLFIANYSSTPGVMPAGWASQTLWQYSDTGTFPGDQDVFNGSSDQLTALAGLGQHIFEAATAGGPVTADGYFGHAGDQDLSCNWFGKGSATVGTFRDGVWSLSSSVSSSTPAASFAFGATGDQPICGDWNGGGVDTVGVYRNGVVYLRNSNSSGPPAGSFYFGAPGDVAITGDWDGDGYTTLGVHRGGLFYLTNSNLKPMTAGTVGFGNSGDLPVAGDWNGDGYTTLGVVRSGMWYLANSNLAPRADLSFALGNTGDTLVAGRWTGGRNTGVGVVRN